MRVNHLRALHGYRMRRWSVGKRNRAWVTEITYIRTWQGWLYLAVAMDCSSVAAKTLTLPLGSSHSHPGAAGGSAQGMGGDSALRCGTKLAAPLPWPPFACVDPGAYQ